MLRVAAFWIGAADGAISIRESAYEAFLARGDNARAALSALTLQRQHAAMLQDSVAAAWLTQAEWLPRNARIRGPRLPRDRARRSARARGDPLRHSRRSNAPATPPPVDRPQPARLGPHATRHVPLDSGRVDEGRPLMEEVAAAAAGEHGTLTTGAVLSTS